MFPPERIVCLTEETVETLYLLGEERRIVAICAPASSTVRETSCFRLYDRRRPKKMLDLKPDLVLTFSDLQADIAATLGDTHSDPQP